MFILRVYNSKGLESNTVIGDSYNVIRKEDHPEEFEKFCKAVPAVVESGLADSAFAVITYNSGASYRLLYKKQENYVMTESGSTFCRLRE